MQSHSAVNLTPPNRQESLRLWMGRTDNTFKAWGRQLGISGKAVSSLCDNETMPTARHAQLVALGVPKELLPPPLDIKPGPKPKAPQGEFMAAFRGV